MPADGAPTAAGPIAGAPAPGSIELHVERTDRAAQERFSVAREGAYVILDLLASAARQDPSLAYRYSCRSGFCGTCTVVVDERPVLACQSPVPAAARTRVGPLGGFPIVRDLIVDHAPFADRWDAIAPALSPSPPELFPIATPRRASARSGSGEGDAGSTGPRPLAPHGREVIRDSVDCISCGACFAACDVSSEGAVFLGPAALTRAMVVTADRRDTARDARLPLVAGRSGVEGCHGIGACSLACPKGLDPARAIRRLRRWSATGLP